MTIDENRFVCIHGHFYQPPRENPWIEEIELEDSAAPFPNWNERITYECYAPNAYARILDKDGKITKIKNNYEKISFNFGPTLLDWLEKKVPSVYKKILEADENSKKFNGGHGNAIAQIYNHIIMPLALKRDKETEIIWGIKSFERDFKRKPEGMWLSETAVDLETIELLIEHGIKFIILSPHQASKIRKIGTKDWIDIDIKSLDTTRCYKLNISNNKSISVFFYNKGLSSEIAFNGILKEGVYFIDRIIYSFDPSKNTPQLVNAATDGESYGHHKKFAEMALAYALEHIESRKLATIINYGYFLELFPPEFEVEIVENTSWSDSQGVERWRSDLGDSISEKPDWNQKWRTPLRDAMNFLKDKADKLYVQEISKYLQDPWAARNDYIDVIINRTEEQRKKFLSIYKKKKTLNEKEVHKIISLMEMQRNSLLMFTSCGWFFDDMGIEAKQILKYAIRVIQIAKEFDWDLEQEYKNIMNEAKSNIPPYKTGDIIFDEVKYEHIVNFEKAISNYALLSTMVPMEKKCELYVYKLHNLDHVRLEFGYAICVIGYLEIFSNLTCHFEKSMFIGIKLERDFLGGAKLIQDFDDYERDKKTLANIFERESMTELIRAVDHIFKDQIFGITDLFFKERKQVLNELITSNFIFLDTEFNQFYNTNLKFMRYLKNISVQIPDKFKLVLEYVLNQDLTQQFDTFLKEKNYENLKKTLQEGEYWGVKLDTTRFDKEITRTIINLLNTILKSSLKNPNAITLLEQIEEALDFAVKYKLDIIMWEIQNEFIHIIEDNIELLKEIKRMKRSEIDFKFVQVLSLINTIGTNLNLDIEIIMRTIIGSKMI
ncbi:MAG: DUF3536 domain-containing protein [Candidatus Helarchaeota archaeon]|nr:DUF3536 domain-containing protein [Candidatus Helarchaeota archaeon]